MAPLLPAGRRGWGMRELVLRRKVPVNKHFATFYLNDLDPVSPGNLTPQPPSLRGKGEKYAFIAEVLLVGSPSPRWEKGLGDEGLRFMGQEPKSILLFIFIYYGLKIPCD